MIKERDIQSIETAMTIHRSKLATLERIRDVLKSVITEDRKKFDDEAHDMMCGCECERCTRRRCTHD